MASDSHVLQCEQLKQGIMITKLDGSVKLVKLKKKVPKEYDAEVASKKGENVDWKQV